MKCKKCNTKFEGNFCPQCGEKAVEFKLSAFNSSYPIFNSKEEYDKYSPWASGKNSNNEYSNAMFLYWAQNTEISLNNDSYPRYMAYDFNIFDPVSKYKQMISEGYLVLGDITETLKALKVQELKTILDENGISKTGRKDDLIDRIIKNVGINTINNLPQIYVLSPRGKKLTDRYYEYEMLFKHKNTGVTVDLYDTKKRQIPTNRSFYDIIQTCLDDLISENIKSKNYGMVTCNWLSKEKLYFENENYTKSLNCLLTSICYNISGATNGEFYDELDEIRLIKINTKHISELKQYLSQDLIKKSYSNCKVPFNYFDLSTFNEIINDIFNGKEITLCNYKHKENTKPFPKTEKDWDKWIDNYVVSKKSQ